MSTHTQPLHTQPFFIFDNVSVTGRLEDGTLTSLVTSCSGKVCAGDRISLLGRSGSGKSVLLRAVAGLIPLSAGTMNLFARPYRQFQPSEWRLQVGLITQHPQMQSGSVLDNLKLPFQFQQNRCKTHPSSPAPQHSSHQSSHQSKVNHQPCLNPPSFEQQWHEDKLRHFDKDIDFLQQPANRLSGGEQQIVNLLRGLQRHPRLLLLDEPTASLDSKTSEQLHQLIDCWHLQHPDHAIIWITHDDTEVKKMSELVWVMDKGKLTTAKG